jgi:uncharacterized OB-fold protein
MLENDFSQSAFRAFLEEHKLMASVCDTCGTKYLPPKPLCTHCYGEAMAWSEVEGVGELQAFTTVHIAPTSMLDAGYGRDNPYCAGIVKLVDGLSISAQITGVDANQPEKIKIGTRMEVEFIKRGDGETKKTYLAFHPIQ